jgi:hypothetical protein
MRAQVTNALKSPLPASVPSAAGAEARVRWVTRVDDGKVEGELSGLRLASGKVSPRGKPAAERK